MLSQPNFLTVTFNILLTALHKESFQSQRCTLAAFYFVVVCLYVSCFSFLYQDILVWKNDCRKSEHTHTPSFIQMLPVFPFIYLGVVIF